MQLTVRIRSGFGDDDRDGRVRPSDARRPARAGPPAALGRSQPPGRSAIASQTTAPSNILVRFESLHCPLREVYILLERVHVIRSCYYH